MSPILWIPTSDGVRSFRNALKLIYVPSVIHMEDTELIRQSDRALQEKFSLLRNHRILHRKRRTPAGEVAW